MLRRLNPWLIILVIAGASGCRESARALGPSPPASRENADALLTALAVRFGSMDREPAFDALRPKGSLNNNLYSRNGAC